MKMMEINQAQVSGVDSFKLQSKINSPVTNEEEMEKLCFSDSDDDNNHTEKSSIESLKLKSSTTKNNIILSENHSNGILEDDQLNGIKDKNNKPSGSIELDEISEDSLSDDIAFKVNDEDDDGGIVDEMMEDELLDDKHNLNKNLITNNDNILTIEKENNTDKENSDLINKTDKEKNNYLEDISSSDELELSEPVSLKLQITSNDKNIIIKDSDDKNIINYDEKKSNDNIKIDENNIDINDIEKLNNISENVSVDNTHISSPINIQNSDDSNKIIENNCDKINNDFELINEKKTDDIDKFLSAIDNAIENDDDKNDDDKNEKNSINSNSNTNLDNIIMLDDDDDDDEKDLNLEKTNNEKKNEEILLKENSLSEDLKTETNKITNTLNNDVEEIVLLPSPKSDDDNTKTIKKSTIADDDDDDEEIVFIECTNINQPDVIINSKKNVDNDDFSDDDIIFFEDASTSKISDIDKIELNQINDKENTEKNTIVENQSNKEKEIENNKIENVELNEEKLKNHKEDEVTTNDIELVESTKSNVEIEKVTEQIATSTENNESDKPIKIAAKNDASNDGHVEDKKKSLDNENIEILEKDENIEILEKDENIEKLEKKSLENNIDESNIELSNNIEKENDLNIDSNKSILDIENNDNEKSSTESSTKEIIEKNDNTSDKMDITESELDIESKSAEIVNTDDNVNILKIDKISSESCELKITELISDNSDNARDIFVEKKIDEANETSVILLESNENKNHDEIENQNNNKETDKVLEEEIHLENIEEPPQKKVKFIDDIIVDDKSENVIDKTEEILKKQIDDDEDIVLIDEDNTTLDQQTNSVCKKPLKRTLSQENISNSSKKIKVDGDKTSISFQYKSTEIESQISNISEKPTLYPAPKLPVTKSDIRLDFLKRFKRSINTMTKKDLEELVMQKIVESIIHTSEFGELRDLIEKQEQIIEQHRKKVTELSKQFKDLEMVHNRVLKDLETRNQQFIMPVKITRAVGLQVVIPSKVPNRPLLSTFSPGQGQTRDRDILTNQSLQRSQPSTSSTQTNLNSNSNTSPDSKRGRSHQKFTPLRPDTPQNSPLNRNNNSSSVGPSPNGGGSSGNTLTPVLSTNLSQKINAQNLTQQQQHQLKMQQQQKQQQMQQVLAQKQLQQAQQQAALKRAALQQQNPNGMVHFPQNSITNNPSLGNQLAVRKLTGGSVRSPTNIVVKKSTSQIRSSPQQDNRVNALLTKPQQLLTVNSDPAKKSFIDLTDEDEQQQQLQLQQKSNANNNGQQSQQLPALVAIPSSNPQNSRISTYVVNNKANIAHQQQRTVVNNRVQQGNNRPQQQNLVTIQRQLPVSTTATRVLPTQHRQQQQQIPSVRYIHPAPLPRAPTLLSNPSWKEQPPRPAIHISNIETGIVISWTMDDLSDRHADVTSYQIYAYQETAAAPQVDAWRHVGDVKAMLLPMAVTLTQFQEGQRYFFAVRAVDVHNRCGNFSPPKTWA